MCRRSRRARRGTPVTSTEYCARMLVAWTLAAGPAREPERAALYTHPVPRTLIVTNDFPPRRGGIQSFVHALATRLPADTVTVYAPAWKGAVESDAPQPFPVITQPTSLIPPL